MHLLEMCKKLGRALPPPYLDTSKREHFFLRRTSLSVADVDAEEIFGDRLVKILKQDVWA